MRVAILSAGPSLLKTWKDDAGYDLVVGVNRAVLVFECDWGAAADWDRCLFLEGMVRVGILTVRKTLRVCEVEGCLRDGLKYEMLWNAKGCDPEFTGTWTLPVTIRTVIRKWDPLEIDVYGCDMAGNSDCKGERMANRDAERWRDEKIILDRVVDKRVRFVECATP